MTRIVSEMIICLKKPWCHATLLITALAAIVLAQNKLVTIAPANKFPCWLTVIIQPAG